MKHFNDYINEVLITHDSIERNLGKYSGKIFLQTLDVYREGIYIVHDRNSHSKLTEGVIKTYPSLLAIKMLISKFSEQGIEIPIWIYNAQKYVENEVHDKDTILPHIPFIITRDECDETIIDLLKNSFLGSGYYLGANKSVKRNNEISEFFQFEPKFHLDETNFLGRYLYHATTKTAWEKISKRGIFPTSKCFTYDGRCFFFKKRDSQLIERYLRVSGKKNIKAGIVNDDFVLLEIDRIELNNTTFYGDPNMPLDSAVFTYENIPMKAIKKALIFKVTTRFDFV